MKLTSVRQLFIDDALIASTDLRRTFHKPRPHPASPVMTPQTPLERNGGVMPAAALASVFFDEREQLYKMWYLAGYDDALAYAFSHDGIEWVRPELDVVPGSNRVLPPLAGYVRNGATVWLDERSSRQDERYKLLVFYRAGTGGWPRAQPDPMPPEEQFACIHTSADGIHWDWRGRSGPCGDNTSFYRDALRDLWCFSIRTFGGVQGRLRSMVETHDFVEGAKWSAADVRPWLRTDAMDRPDEQLQWMPELYKVDCAPYESIMVGLWGIYLGPPNHLAGSSGMPKTIDLHVAFSRDGSTWSRPDRTAFIACSRRQGAWDRGYLQASAGVCVTRGDELWFYYSGFSGVSPVQGANPYAGGSLGLATLRRDGFASMDGPGERMPAVDPEGGRVKGLPATAAPAAGVLTTVPLQIAGDMLFVNACVRRGELRIEVLDEAGAVIEGYGAADSMPITGDSTRHVAAWHAADIAGLSGRLVRLRFWLPSGELYSFWSDSAPAHL